MFDWEDQEIANIIWGEADDQIVTYPEESEKKSQSLHEDPDKSEANEDAAKSKPSEQKSAATKTELPGERNDELSILASNSDLNSIGKKIDPDKDPEIPENQDEDGGLGDIIGSNWANIESFDDLNHIFSNDELVDPASLDTTDEFWAPSQDVLDNNWGLEALGNSSAEFNFNLPTENQSYGNIYEKETDSPCYTQKMLHSRFDEEEIDVATDPNLISDKTAAGMNGKNESEPIISASINKSPNMSNWSRPQLKHDLKSQKINNHTRLNDAHGTWAPPAIVPAINIQQFDTKKMPQQPTNLPYQQLSNPYFATYPYIPDMLPATDLREKNYTLKPPKMTPQEKIEKLRKRQQMRAMLAIQKQQQHLSHHVPVDYTGSQMSSQDGDFKGEENVVPTYDPSSPLKQEDSSSISVEVDDQNVEETVLYQLQETVSKLDMNIRLCMRDSLFRLARSAMQRHSANDLSIGNRNGETNVLQEDTSNQDSFTRMPNAETDTNQIDRAVAHLLFHRPIKSSAITPKMTPDPETGSFKGVLKEEQSNEDVIRNQKMKQKMVESVD